jgi:hypothetical protein
MTQEPRTPYLPPDALDDPLLDERTEVYLQPTTLDAPPSTSDTARDRAADLGQNAGEAGKHVAGVAKDEAADVVGEAQAQARNVLNDARGEVRDQADTQQKRAAQSLHALSRELRSMAEASDEQGAAAQASREVSQRAHDVASWLDSRGPDELLDDVRAFARRRPAAFLGIALAAGVVAGRLTRGATASQGQA